MDDAQRIKQHWSVPLRLPDLSLFPPPQMFPDVPLPFSMARFVAASIDLINMRTASPLLRLSVSDGD